jgi:hypothetical protein
MSANDQIVSVLVGPTCPACESDDLRWTASLGAVKHGQCRDCGTEYRWYHVPVVDDEPQELTCPGCGVPSEEDGQAMTCEDCGPSDCLYCGTTVYRWMLSENLACQECEDGEAA